MTDAQKIAIAKKRRASGWPKWSYEAWLMLEEPTLSYSPAFGMFQFLNSTWKVTSTSGKEGG